VVNTVVCVSRPSGCGPAPRGNCGRGAQGEWVGWWWPGGCFAGCVGVVRRELILNATVNSFGG